MKEREVTAAEVEEIIGKSNRPEERTTSGFNVFGFLHGRFIRVTYKDLPDRILVITVVVRKKPFQGTTS